MSLEATSQLLSGDGEDNGSCRKWCPCDILVLQLCCRFKIRVPKNCCFSIQLGKEHILTRQLLVVVNERGLAFVVGWVMASKDIHILIPGTYECYLIWQEGLGRCDWNKNLERRGLSWIMWMGPEWHHKCLSRKKAEGDLTPEEKTVWPQRHIWGDATTSQRTPRARRS